ncbi:MAG TPA: sodium:proton antiporter [Bacteroidales bacterium]|nr:sodium:proton antiporter [Bacteroidales bacterium]
MELFHIISVLLVLSALFAYINIRFLKLPGTIGIMLLSLIFSLLILFSGQVLPQFKIFIASKLNTLNFSELLLEELLSFMLFAGAFHIKYEDLKSEKLSIFLFSTLSVILNTVIIGFASYFLFSLFGIKLSLINAMLFGALISPTDPIAVLGILKTCNISKSLETRISGESLFNDGVGVVIFLTILKIAGSDPDFGTGEILLLFGQEALGGLLLGILLGFIGYRLFVAIDNYKTEVLITIAIVMGGYTLAHYLHVSGPLTMVVAGLITGNHGKTFGMSATTIEYVDKFWELIDDILNAILFVLIGLELIVINTDITIITVSVLLIIVVLLSRYTSLLIPSILTRLKEKIYGKTLILMTWAGLRGGISIALALSVPADLGKDILVTSTYVIVCFSILVQGLTIKKLAGKIMNVKN